MRVDLELLLVSVVLLSSLISCGGNAGSSMQILVSDTIQRITKQKGIDYGSVYAEVVVNGHTQRFDINEGASQTVIVQGIVLDALNEIRVDWWEVFQGSPLRLSHQSGTVYIASTDESTIIAFPHISEPYDSDLDDRSNLMERTEGTCPVLQACAIVEPDMISIPAGSFQMGAVEDDARDNEYPRHPVTVDAFYLAEAEVTWGEWAVCVEAGGCTEVTKPDWVASLANPARHPLGGVSWDQIQSYLVWINAGLNGGYRLPTEAEFEYAMRGGTSTKYFYGDDNSNYCLYVNGFNNPTTCDDGYLYSSPVKSFLPNPFGLYDINGNVGEWTSDCWHDNYIDAPATGEPWLEAGGGSCGEGPIRGGNYKFDSLDFRGSSRRKKSRHPDFPEEQEGFRLARD